MPSNAEIAEPLVEKRVLPRQDEEIDDTGDGPYVVILYNCDCHSMDEVVAQLLKATEYSLDRCMQIMMEAHLRGRAIAYTGSESACIRAANILRQIRLQVETDKF